MLIRKIPLLSLLLFSAITVSASLAPGNSGVSDSLAIDRPNIIFILIDDMGYGDLGAFGNKKIKTPHIDRLAKEGIKFTNFYVGAPICSPSRVAALTGQYPSRHRINSFLASRERNQKRSMPDFLDPNAPSIARAMKTAGYKTAHFGKWHMGGGRDVGDAPHPKAYGFDESLVSFEGLGDRLLIKDDDLSAASAKLGQGEITWVEKHEITPILVDRTLDFIKQHQEERFYIHLWTGDVHDPFHPKEEHLKMFEEYANNPYEQKFLAVLYQLDLQIGRILSGLDEMGLTNQTLMVLASDNGPTDWQYYYEENYTPPGSQGPFRGRKWSLYEGGIRVPFLARWPNHIPAGLTNDYTMLNAVDLFPTLCRLAEVPMPMANFDGEDMSRALTGKVKQREKPLFWNYGSEFDIKPGDPKFRSPNLAIRDGSWKLLVNRDGSSVELYNLQDDQAETTNVANRHPEVVRRLSDQLFQWYRDLSFN
jgi:arylsulfatase A-like enzyme